MEVKLELEKYKKILDFMKAGKEELFKKFDFKKLMDAVNFKNIPMFKRKNSEIEKIADDFHVKDFIDTVLNKFNITDTEELAFIYATSVNLIFEELQKICGDKIAFQDYLGNKCPFCGEQIEYAYIADDGKKFLVCSCCRTEWRYPRIKCPFCETENQKKLSYIELEGIDYFRFYECEECGNFHKVFLIEKIKSDKPLNELDVDTKGYDIAYENNR